MWDGDGEEVKHSDPIGGAKCMKAMTQALAVPYASNIIYEEDDEVPEITEILNKISGSAPEELKHENQTSQDS